MNKEEISKMTKAEQIRQLEWSDHHEFSYGYAYYLLEENEQLKEEIKGYQQMYFDKVMILNKAIEYIEKEWHWDGTGIDNLEDILIGGSNE